MSSSGRSDVVDIAGVILHRTDRAIRFHDGIRTVWLPLSQVETGALEDCTHGIVAMPEWLAKEKELI